MHNGTALLDGYVPDEDATVVERVLDAGATILVSSSAARSNSPASARASAHAASSAAIP